MPRAGLDWARNWSSPGRTTAVRKPDHLSGMAEVKSAEGQSCEPKGTPGASGVLSWTHFRDEEIETQHITELARGYAQSKWFSLN